jgi:UDP-GlcNAc:undecaprenyl-phosphate GlcNAc-1-phosphate transferase
MVGSIATAVLCTLGRRLQTMDSPGGAGSLKRLRNVPNIGGIAVAWPLIAAIGGAGVVILCAPNLLGDIAPASAEWLDRLQHTAPTAIAFAGVLLILHIMGLLDDRREVSAAWKLLVQCGLAVLLVVFFDVRVLRQLDGWMGIGMLPSVILSVGWIIVITNAMNFLDNMDGLTAGVTVVAGGLLLVTAMLSQQWFVASTLAVLVGTTAGFLLFNLPPAKIFLGDSGSLVIGMTLAVLTIRTTYWEPASASDSSANWYAMLMPLAVLAVPLYDFVSVTIIRIGQGKSPFRGDHQHFSHRLVQRGLSPRRAVFIMWSLTAVTGIIGLLLPSLAPWEAGVAGFQIAIVIGILILLETGADR